jgi:hypothetical protein
MNRREVIKKVGLSAGTVLIAGQFLGISACNVYNDIMQYIPVALTAFSTIVSILNPGVGATILAVISMVKVALADVQTAVTNYENAPSSEKVTLSGKIATAINAAEAELQQFWSDLKLPDGNLATLIEGVINVIVSTLAAFLPQLAPAIPVPAKTLTKRINYTAKKRSIKQFKSDLNAEFTKGGYPVIFK